MPRRRSAAILVSAAARRLAYACLVLIAIAFLSYWGLTMAQNAVASLPAEPLASAVEAAKLTADHFLHHPSAYIVHKASISPWLYIAELLRNSLMLLIPALLLAFGAGVPLGMRAARAHTRGSGSLIWLISILGISVPAFMLAMFLWVINIQAGRQFNLTPLPATGLGLDQHLVLPVLVLAARPFAVLTQVTYITIAGLLTQDFVRTARGKGVGPRAIDRHHVMRNAWIPILTAVATSLRFSLATLPIVEYFFVWPGIGLGLLQAITAGHMTMAVDMVLALGVVFLSVNIVLEAVYPLLDPRLRDAGGMTETGEQAGLRGVIVDWFERLRGRWRRRNAERRLRVAQRDRVARPQSDIPRPSSAGRPPPAMRQQLAGYPSAPERVRSELRWLIEQAKVALGHGDRAAARRLARGAVRLDPHSEAAWLTLAATSDPRSALAYAARALEINPHSQPARRAIRWAVRQLPHRVRREALREPRKPTSAAAAPSPPKGVRPAKGPLAAPGGAAAGARGWAVLRDPVLVVAAALGLVLLFLVVFGGRLTDASPYVSHGVMVIEGVIGVPPYAPSSVFPWGTDQIGRDMRALILHGARQTLTLALLVVGARLAVGVVAGMIAGWWKGGLFDRFVAGVLSVWAAFPITLFVMILILAIGIERGMSTFVLALCFVGWGEIAQYIRSEVIALRTKPFLEGARAVGAAPDEVLRRHILPNLAPSILVLASLEMGAVLLILAELGFLSIFVGGGYRVMLGEVGSAQAVIATYSDVPEWAALLANIRQWWRSYPWLAWSPAIAFSLAILAFNLGGEGLRRVLEKSRVSPARLINRATLGGAVVLVAVGVWIFNTTAPLGEYRSQATGFNLDRAMATVAELSLPAYGGRETGTDGAQRAAEYIASEMEAIGLFPGGQHVAGSPLETYFASQVAPRIHLTDVPTMSIVGADGERNPLRYREDFAEYPLGFPGDGPVSGRVVGIAAGAAPAVGSDPFGVNRLDVEDKVILVRQDILRYLPGGRSQAILVVSEDPPSLQQRFLYPGLWTYRPGFTPFGPMMLVSPELADRLLASSGISLAEMDRISAGLGAGEAVAMAPGPEVELQIPAAGGVDPNDLFNGETDINEKYVSVIGYIPGAGSEMGMDDDVIIVSAYYDGPGTGPDGVLYPGANDNLSAVATMLEMARVLKQGEYAPDKTIVFVAWAGGERMEGFSVTNAMGAKIGFSDLNVEAVLELNGVGGGSGKAIALGPGTSFRLTRLIEAAARRMGTAVTTRGTGPHSGLPNPLGFGDRQALSAFISWDGSDDLAHTVDDSPANLQPTKMGALGKTLALVLTVLSRETNY